MVHPTPKHTETTLVMRHPTLPWPIRIPTLSHNPILTHVRTHSRMPLRTTALPKVQRSHWIG